MKNKGKPQKLSEIGGDEGDMTTTGNVGPGLDPGTKKMTLVEKLV